MAPISPARANSASAPVPAILAALDVEICFSTCAPLPPERKYKELKTCDISYRKTKKRTLSARRQSYSRPFRNKRWNWKKLDASQTCGGKYNFASRSALNDCRILRKNIFCERRSSRDIKKRHRSTLPTFYVPAPHISFQGINVCNLGLQPQPTHPNKNAT